MYLLFILLNIRKDINSTVSNKDGFIFKMKFKLILALIGFQLLSEIKCSNILVIFPHISFSHYNLGFTISKELANRGHNVTLIAPFNEPEKVTNLNTIFVEENAYYKYPGKFLETLSFV